MPDPPVDRHPHQAADGLQLLGNLWRILVAIIPFIVLTLVLFIGGFIGLYLYTRVRYA